MPVPQFDIISFVKLWLAPNYRLRKFLASVNSFLSGISWKNGVFQAYMNGDPQVPYDSGMTYSTGNSVTYNFATYESLIDANTGNAPDINPDKWVLRCASFIGAYERAKYNGRYLNLTFQLNRYFQQQITDAGLTGFRQPPYPAPYDFGLGGGTWSDIYITNAAITFVSFMSGGVETGSDSSGAVDSTGFVGALETFGTASSYGFVIHIPTAVYASLGATTAIRDAIINEFVSRYAPSGTTWSINPY